MILDWPSRDLLLVLAFLKREPTAETRIEHTLAALRAQVSAFGGNKNASISDFLLYRECWKPTEPTAEGVESDRYSAVDKSILRYLMQRTRKVNDG